MNDKLNAMLMGLTDEELFEVTRYFEARFKANRKPDQLDRIEDRLMKIEQMMMKLLDALIAHITTNLDEDDDEAVSNG